MKRNSVDEQLYFYNEVINMLGCKCKVSDSEVHDFEIQSRWGKVGIRVPERNPKFYAVYMRFLEPDKVNITEINGTMGVLINKVNGVKWNMYSDEPYHLIDRLEDRLDDIVYLLCDENFEYIMSN